RWARAEIVFNSRKTYERFGWRLDAPLIVMPPITWPTAPPPRSSGPVRFDMAGAFVRLKNLHLVLEAFKRLAEDNPTIELLIWYFARGDGARVSRQNDFSGKGLRTSDPGALQSTVEHASHRERHLRSCGST